MGYSLGNLSWRLKHTWSAGWSQRQILQYNTKQNYHKLDDASQVQSIIFFILFYFCFLIFFLCVDIECFFSDDGFQTSNLYQVSFCKFPPTGKNPGLLLGTDDVKQKELLFSVNALGVTGIVSCFSSFVLSGTRRKSQILLKHRHYVKIGFKI